MGQVIKYINSRGEMIELSSHNPFLLNSIDGLSGVEATEITYKGMNQDGSNYQGSNLEERQITIAFRLLCENASELIKTRSKVNRVFNPKLGNGKLIYSYEGVERELICVSDGTPFMSLQGSRCDCEGEIVLLAHDPFFTDTMETKVEIANWKGKFKFPLTILSKGIMMGEKDPSTIVNVFNGGDVSCGAIIVIKCRGTAKNPSILNVNTREYIKIKREMKPGEIITINTNYGNKKIESNLNGSITNILNCFDLTSTFLQLDIGDNVLKYDSESNINNLEVSIYFNTKYLGV